MKPFWRDFQVLLDLSPGTCRRTYPGLGSFGENTWATSSHTAVAEFSSAARSNVNGARAAPGVEIRTHGTVLHNSIYRFDDEMIVNPHVYGKVASHAPALHLRRLSAGDLFTTYEDSFSAVWEGARRLT